MNQGLYSSESGEWSTPLQLVDDLERRYGSFDLDPCASIETAKAPRFYTEDDDGLTIDWYGHVFMNPPYGRVIGKWVRKAHYEAHMPSVHG